MDMEQNSRLSEFPEQFSLCLRVRAQLQDYVEGYLDLVTAETVRAHLAVCALCNREHAEILETIRLVRTLPFVSPRRDYAGPITAAIAARPHSPWRRWWPRARRPSL